MYYKKIRNDKVRLPFTSKGSVHTYNQFTIRVKNRRKLELHLKKHNIPYGIYYSMPMYKYNAYKNNNYQPLPMVEKVSKECLSIPIYPELPIKHVMKISEVLNNYE